MALRTPSMSRGLAGRLASVAVECCVPVGLAALWWFASASSTSLYFPPLSRAMSAFRDIWLSSRFTSDALPSLEHLAGGLGVAAAVGVCGGIALGSMPALSDILSPVLEFLRALPGVALVPAALLVLGIGTTMQISVIASAAVWPILLNTVDGVRGLNPVLGDVARSYRIGAADRLRMVSRAASPQIVAGLRTALSIGVTMIVFSEMVGSTSGIGYQLLQSQRAFDMPGMWAAMILLGILGYGLNLAFRRFERTVLKWHRGMRQTGGQ